MIQKYVTPEARPLVEISALAFLTGFFSLCVQVISTHYAFLAHPQSSYAIGMSLFAFLTGLGTASGLAVRYQEGLQTKFRAVMAWIFTGVGTYFYILTLFANELREGVRRLCLFLSVDPQTQYTYSITILSLFFLFLPAIALGLLFPVINDRRSRIASPETGRTSFFDYVGAGTGSLICAFFLIPTLGLKNSSLLISVTMLAASLPWHLQFMRLFITTIALVLPQVSVRTGFGEIAHAHPSILPQRILFSQPSPFGEISVIKHQIKDNQQMTLVIGQRPMCGAYGNISERLLAEIPLELIGRSGLRILNVGLGCGATAHEIRRHPKTGSLDIVEINPVVVKAQAHFEATFSSTPVQAQIHVADGFDYIRQAQDPYDLVIVDVEEPSVLQSSALFTQDFFKAVDAKLAPDGYFTLWTFFEPQSGKVILNTLKSVFPEVDVMVHDRKLVFVAARRKFNTDRWAGSKKRKRLVLEATPTEIATVAANPYAKYFKINSIFNFPEWYEDPREMRN